MTEKKDIRLVLCDVDGTLTDGGMYYNAQGDAMKRFYVRDGMGLKLLQKAGIKVGIITSETTDIVSSRAKKLEVDYLFQGVRFEGKLEVIKQLCSQIGINMQQVAFIGDDVNDIDLLSAVGLAACPNDAAQQVKNIPNILIAPQNGGHGAVRYLADIILNETLN